MMIYLEALNNPVKTDNISSEAKELVFSLVSCRCENISYIRIKEVDGKTVIKHYNNHCGLALSNLQMSGDYRTDLTWAFEDKDWNKLVSVINSGTSQITKIRSR